MKILITGATGIIGSKIIKKLKLIKNCEIKILIRKKETCNFDKTIGIIRGDLIDLNSLNKATKNIDIVLHLAGITHTNKNKSYYKINTTGTENLLKECEKNNVKKFIFISSRTAGLNGGAYAKSKYYAEKMAERYKQNWIILSLAEVYGAGEKDTIYKLLNFAKKWHFIPIMGNGEYLLSPVFVDDVVDTIINAIQNNNIHRKKYIITGPEELTYNEIINQLSSILNKRIYKIYLPIFIFKILAFIFFIFNKKIITRDQIPRLLCEKPFGINSAAKDLNFTQRSFKDGINIILKNNH
jgi:NADH dehydrogenase